MISSEYFTVYCILRGTVNELIVDELDELEFDAKIHDVELTLSRHHPQRHIRLETTYYFEGYAEITFVFKASYLEDMEDIDNVIHEAKQEIESTIDFTVDEIEIESIV